MNDTLQNISHDPAILLVEEQLKATVTPGEEEGLNVIANSGTDTQYAPKIFAEKQDTLVHRAPPRKAIVLTAHKEAEMPVSPRSVGSTTTSWVILGLIAVFLLVSLRYARNFKFLSAIGRDLISRQPRSRMFDDTVRESSFLIFLNLLCVVSVGVLLFGAIEMMHPFLRQSAQWYTSLGLVTAAVGCYYLWQWMIYFILGLTFGSRTDASTWMRGFSSGQAYLGLALFLPALISIFYPQALYPLVVASAVAYILMRILFIIKGIRIFLPRSGSWMLFFYYLCAVEIAPVVLLIHLSTRICLAVAAA